MRCSIEYVVYSLSSFMIQIAYLSSFSFILLQDIRDQEGT